MDKATYWRARTIVKRGEVLPNTRKSSNKMLCFKVKQRNGEWCDVWRKKELNEITWSCDSVTNKKNGDKWGCIMYTGSKKEPFCSHTLAVKMYIEMKDKEWQEINQKDSTNNKDLIKIDYEVVRNLKKEGRYEEAKALIQAHQTSIKNNFKNFKKETYALYKKKYAFKHRNELNAKKREKRIREKLK